jgi:phosphoglycolate phosphatase-like HAD superfamily hydrolase
MRVKAIILDFDGVVVESNRIKHQAFSEIFSEYPEHYDEMMRYHLAHNHVDRHRKFKYLIEKLLKRKYSRAEGDKLAERFARLTREKIINSPFVDGALEFIKYYSGKYPVYIASATPLDELMIILETRELTKYFKGIYGAPIPKTEMFADLMRKENAAPNEVLFIGDSPEDCDVATESGIGFIARTSEHKIAPDKAKSFRNMSEIMHYLLRGGEVNE